MPDCLKNAARCAPVLCALVLGSLVLAGCSVRSYPVRPAVAAWGEPRAPGAPGSAIGSSAVVFASPRVAAADASLHDGFKAELTRRDDALNVRQVRTLTATDHWPEPDRASLEHARIISIPRSARHFLIFPRPERAPAPGAGWRRFR